ncbi:MAG: SH3 domain-containing protein, partial [Terriglobales bacterium]
MKPFLYRYWLLAVASLAIISGLMLLPACNRGGSRVLEVAYVSGVQAILRDRVAAVYEKAGVVKNGDRVEVLDHDRRFVKVRTATGVTGWVEQRYLVGQEVYDQIQKLTADNQNDPIQAEGTTRNDTNLHVEPGRDTEHLYQISSGEKLALLKRSTAEKPGSVAAPARSAKAAGNNKEKEEEKKPVPVLEDWWLVRDSHSRVGWVLGRMIDLDVPLEVAQYAEGQRIVAFFALDQVKDGDKQ